MRMSEISFEGPSAIDAYGGGGFRLGGRRHEGSLALLPRGSATWPVAEIADITLETLEIFIAEAEEFDVLLIGMGADIAALAAPLRAALDAAGIGVEIMGTGAACRTYNVLLAEDRRVAAALIAV